MEGTVGLTDKDVGALEAMIGVPMRVVYVSSMELVSWAEPGKKSLPTRPIPPSQLTQSTSHEGSVGGGRSWRSPMTVLSAGPAKRIGKNSVVIMMTSVC